ncbi:MAG: hypothetical protein DMF78_04410 [Acidobacteria bacterium]|nr:MAG: hypothetical protein DMF78_04410 [Acidobacteriota bacterium]
MIDVREAAGGASLRVRVKPRARRDELAGEQAGALVVRLTAPPVEGEANAALVRFLARALGLPASAVAIARGVRGRDKVLIVAGLGVDDLRARLSAAGGAR